MTPTPRFITLLRYSARTLAIAATLTWTVFALLSGTEAGITGLIGNLPNILPFLLLALTTYAALREELLGGVSLVLLGMASVVFFNAWTSPFVLLGLSLPVSIAGVSLILCSYLDNPKT